MKAIIKNIKSEIEVRKMTNDEIDNSEIQHYCNDESYVIYTEDEIECVES